MLAVYTKIVGLLLLTGALVGYVFPWLISANDSLLVLGGIIGMFGYLYAFVVMAKAIVKEWRNLK